MTITKMSLVVMFLSFNLLSQNLFAAEGWNKTPTEAHPYFGEGKIISGEVVLSQKLIERGFLKKNFKFDQDDVIYVIARKSSKAGSPPVAVVRIDDLAKKTFPIAFKIGPADLMMEGKFIGPFSLKAKLSRSGGATTSPGDLIGYSADNKVKMGAKDLKIALTEVAGSQAKKPNLQASAHSGMKSNKKTVITTKPTKSTVKAISGLIDVTSHMKNQLTKSKFKFKSSDVLYVIAKKADSPGNQPLAVVRLTNLSTKKFPLSFSIGPEDMMMGDASSFKGPFQLKAKLSRSGGVTTQKGDLYSDYSDSEKITLGNQKVRIKLKSLK